MASLQAKSYFNTEYLCAHHTLAIEEMCEVLGNRTLDMTGVKATKDAMVKLSDMIKDHGIVVIDTQDATRNDLFKQARERRYAKVSTKILPKLEKFEDFKEYVGSLDKNEVYELGNNVDGKYICPLVTLIQIYRPAIQIEVSLQYHQLAAYACSYLYRKGAKDILSDCKEFVLVLPTTTFDITVPTSDVDDEFSLPGIGKVSFQELTNKYYLVPKKLGSEQVLKNDPNALWKKFSERAWEDLQRYYFNNRQTLEDFLEV